MMRGKNWASDFVFPIKLLFGLGSLVAFFSNNHSHLFEFATPFCWLVLYPFSEDGTSQLIFPRTLLCTTAVIQTLYAFPVAGSQVSFIQVLLTVVGIVCIGDFLLWFNARYALGLGRYRLVRVSGLVLLLFLGLDYLYLAYVQREIYESLPSLNLAGAARIHLQRDQARDYQWLTASAIHYCDILVGLPNIPSLNFWTAMDPPARMTGDAWTLVLTNKEQMEIVSALSGHPRACAVYNPDILAIWDRNHRDLSGLPLVRFIDDNFKTVGSMDNYFFSSGKSEI